MTLFLSLIALVFAAVAGYALGGRRPVAKAATDTAISVGDDAAARQARAVEAVASDSGHGASPSVSAAVHELHDAGGEKARIIRSQAREIAALTCEHIDAAAERWHLVEFKRDRAELQRMLGQSRAETARYRQLVVDIENNAPPPILTTGTGPDDLKLIVGIGPVLERMLNALGITHFRQIARWSARDVADFDAKLADFRGRIERDQWVTQARALHHATYGETLPSRVSTFR